MRVQSESVPGKAATSASGASQSASPAGWCRPLGGQRSRIPPRDGGAQQSRGGHQQRERDLQELECDECEHREQRVQRRTQGTAADLHERLQHQHDHRGLQAEQDALGGGQAAEPRISVGQREQQQDRRPDEAEAGDEPAARAVQPPAEIDRELQRLGPGQQHAEIERVGETTLVEPAAPLDHLAVHDRDLPCRPAERDETETEPEARRLGERRTTPSRRQNISDAPGSFASALLRAAMKSPVIISS